MDYYYRISDHEFGRKTRILQIFIPHHSVEKSGAFVSSQFDQQQVQLKDFSLMPTEEIEIGQHGILKSYSMPIYSTNQVMDCYSSQHSPTGNAKPLFPNLCWYQTFCQCE